MDSLLGYRSKDQATTLSISNESSPSVNKPTSSNTKISSDHTMQVSREDYNQLMALLHSSKRDHPNTSHSNMHNQPSDSSPHIVSTLSQSGNTDKSEFLWILDSGASNHVCPHIKFFHSITMINPISVKFPNGSTIMAFYSRSIKFSDTFFLQNVLYTPQFHFNLISVYQLTRSLPCKVVFSLNFCGIQDHHT